MIATNAEELIAKMRGGDPRAELPLETKVEKCNSERRDNHQDGTKGIVKGSLFAPDFNISSYLVLFEGTNVPVFVVGYKVRKTDY